MSFPADLYSYLKGHRQVAALVSDRIYPAPAPQSAVCPHVTYQRISSTGGHAMSGADRLVKETWQLDCWAHNTATESGATLARNLADAVRNALDGYRGPVVESDVSSCFLTNQADSYEPSDDGSEMPYHRVRMDFDFVIVRDVPTFP